MRPSEIRAIVNNLLDASNKLQEESAVLMAIGERDSASNIHRVANDCFYAANTLLRELEV